jgi:flavin reductase (DIM6/NTAB) family NADH-FMN oxidoreductase RutF/rubredoxin
MEKVMNSKALYNISYGLYIVSSKTDSKISGQIANTVIQVCSDPVVISVAINKNKYKHELIKSSKMFTACILDKETPLPFIGNFGFKSGRDVDKFANVAYRLTQNGLPVITEHTVAYLEAKLIDETDVKTHTIFIGEVIDADIIKEGEPMTYAYYQQVKRGTTPKSAPSYIEKKEEKPMGAKYQCSICNYIYDPALGDPDGGIQPGTPFEQIPDSWVCPVCGASKDKFEKMS